jgi:predicted Zn-dependent protease
MPALTYRAPRGGSYLEGSWVPDEVEKWLGDASEASAVEQFGGALNNPAATQYVNDIGQKIVVQSRRPEYGYTFDVLRSDTPNAFALPNGSIYITDSLLRLFRTEAELANVIGHEIAHVTESHSVNQLGVNVGTLGFLTLASAFLGDRLSAEDSETAQGMVFGLATNGYSRHNESESDEKGQKFAAKAGWDPNGMADVMKVFLEMEGERGSKLEEFMRSHPYSGARYEEALERAARMPKGEIGKERYQTFLTNTLGVAQKSAASTTAAARVEGAVVDEFPWGPVIFFGGAAILLAIIIFKK